MILQDAGTSHYLKIQHNASCSSNPEIYLWMIGLNYHFEFTHCRRHPVVPSPTSEDLAVFYIPDALEWQSACASMLAAGFQRVAPFNPYWDVRGCTFKDPDGYCVVLQNASWSASSAKNGPSAAPVLVF